MPLTPKIQPTSGVVGIPAGMKEAGKRVDFKPNDFDLMIETKGYRIAWGRSAQCPCNSVNDQTDQPDPNCTICEGSGWFYFAPSETSRAEIVGGVTTVQQKMVSKIQGAIIRGVMSAGSQQFDPYNKIVNWTEGEMMLTVRSQNKLGYYDKIINLDSEIIYSELVTAKADRLKLRYLATGVNIIRSTDKVYKPETDYELEGGEVVWVAGKEPDEGAQLVCHYLTHPTWLVFKHPHVIRTTPVKFKTAKPETPQGDARPLPIQAVVKLDFLP